MTKVRKQLSIDWKTRKYLFNALDLAMLKSTLKGKTISATAIDTMLAQAELSKKEVPILVDYLDVMVKHIKGVSKTLLYTIGSYSNLLTGTKYEPIQFHIMCNSELLRPSVARYTYPTDIPIIPCLLLKDTVIDGGRYEKRLQYAITYFSYEKDPRGTLLINNSSDEVKSRIRNNIVKTIESNTKLLEELLNE